MEIIKYICESCGQEHQEWPALAFFSPDNYVGLSDEEQDEMAEIDEDLCIITYSDQTDRFIRCVLVQKVNDHCVDLEYGLWVSLSEKSFNDYTDNFDNDNHETSYFGWLCNNIPGYEFENSIPMTVFTQKDGDRPLLVPHKDFDHPFVKDYYNGIAKKEAEHRIQEMLDAMGGVENE